jgi:hypothetical protein
MLLLGDLPHHHCQGLTRREFLSVGGTLLGGLTLERLLRADERIAKERTLGSHGRAAGNVPAQSLILIYLAGGPSQHETFDPKPAAPLRVRGPWGATSTRIPGVAFGEMLPELAALNDRFSLLRALHHTHSLHNPWPMLTGTLPHRISLGATIHALRPGDSPLVPGYVNLGPRLSVGAGALGTAHEPLEIPDPARASQSLAEFLPLAEVSPDRLADRRFLLGQIDTLRRLVDTQGALIRHDKSRERALSILTSTAVREAFDLSGEPVARRDRFGHNSFGQSCLLARRLIEAGTRIVQINWSNREDGFAVGWDVHGDDQTGLVRMEQQLCPRFDQGLSALLLDLQNRGLLDSTLVVVTGEFGRTPHISRLGGRDHWPYCFSALLAGGGIAPGRVVGASDRHGGYPADRPASPSDFAATICDRLGVNPNKDDRLRPLLFEGRPVEELWS